MFGEGQRFTRGCVGHMCANQPLPRSLIRNHVHDPQPLLLREAPEFTHPPGTTRAPGAQLPNMTDVAAQPLFVELAIRRERSYQRRPRSPELLPRPFLGFCLRVAG